MVPLLFQEKKCLGLTKNPRWRTFEFQPCTVLQTAIGLPQKSLHSGAIMPLHKDCWGSWVTVGGLQMGFHSSLFAAVC